MLIWSLGPRTKPSLQPKIGSDKEDLHVEAVDMKPP